MSGSGTPQEIARGELQTLLEQHCLSGLVSAAEALASSDSESVCSAFRRWREEAWRGWPWLPGLCWSALEALGASFPADDPDHVTVGRMLVGAETEVERFRDAIARLHERLDEAAGWQPVPAAGADLAGELRRRSLVSAVDQFWADYAEAMRRLHEPVVLRDRARADARILSARRQLEENAERLDMLVERVLATLAAAAEPSPPAPPAPAPPPAPVVPPVTPELPAAMPAPSGPDTEEVEPLVPQDEDPGGPPTEAIPLVTEPIAAPAEPPRAADVAEPVRSTRPHQPTAPPRAEELEHEPDEEDVEYRRVRDHRYAPIIFLLGVTVGALYWIFHIISGGF